MRKIKILKEDKIKIEFETTCLQCKGKIGGLIYKNNPNNVTCILCECGVDNYINKAQVIENKKGNNQMVNELENKENKMREFETGATRNTEIGKLDYEGFNCPLVDERYAQYLNKHRKQADGKMRASDNWQKGIPLNVYIKSLYRHFIDFRKAHRGYKVQECIEDLICAIIFNAKGYLHELLKKKLYKEGEKEFREEMEKIADNLIINAPKGNINKTSMDGFEHRDNMINSEV